MGRESKRQKRQRRSDFEFTNSARNEIATRSGGVCQECGQAKATQFHHIIAIALALANGITYEVVRHPENGKHVCHKCHQKLDDC